MIYVIIGIIAIILMLLFFIVVLLLTRNQDGTLNTIDKDGKILDEKGQIDREAEAAQNKTKKTNTTKSTQTNAKDAVKREDVFKFMEFDRILDGMIVQKNGSRFTKAIKCKGINYDLMSEVEQLAVEEGFITFLNTLKYPIQLYVQAQNIDLRQTIRVYEQNIEGLKAEYNDINTEYSKLASAFDVDEIELQRVSKERDSITNVYEYAADMVKNVEKMNRNKRMLQRNFYILVSYNTSEITSVEKFNKNELIDMCSTELTTRCQAVLGALASCSVSGKILDSNDLAQLLYNAYNRDDASLMNIKDSLDSGFYRLYSVSEDAFTKEQESLEKYLDDRARLKALEAIKVAIMSNSYKTPAMEQLEEEEETSKRATNMINHEDYEPGFKKQVNKVILDDFRESKKVLLEEDAQEKEIFVEQSKKDLEEMDSIKKRVDDYESKNANKLGVKENNETTEQNNLTEENVTNNSAAQVEEKDNTLVSNSTINSSNIGENPNNSVNTENVNPMNNVNTDNVNTNSNLNNDNNPSSANVPNIYDSTNLDDEDESIV